MKFRRVTRDRLRELQHGGRVFRRFAGWLLVLTMMTEALGEGSVALRLDGGMVAGYQGRGDGRRPGGGGCEEGSVSRVLKGGRASRAPHREFLGSHSRHKAAYKARSLETGDFPTTLISSLVVNVTIVLSKTSAPTFPTSNESLLIICHHIIGNLLLVPDASVLYYTLDERCFFNKSEMASPWLMSVRKADRLPGTRGPAAFDEKDALISYWWPFSDPNGMPPISPVLFEVNSTMEPMAFISGMDLSNAGTSLIVTVFIMEALNKTAGMRGSMVSLLALNGSRVSTTPRVSIPLDGVDVRGVGLNPTKTRVYVSDVFEPPQVLCAPEADLVLGATSGRITSRIFKSIATFPRERGGLNVSGVFIRPQGFVSDDSCLYVVDREEDNVWAMDLVTMEITLVVDWKKLRVFGKSSLREIAVTAEGCNLFVSDINGYVWWIRMESLCGQALTVDMAVRYTGHGFWGLALHEDDSRVSLFVGTNNGRLFELEINRSSLHECPASFPQPPPVSSSSPPPSSGDDRPILSSSNYPPSQSPRDLRSGNRRNITLLVAVSCVAVALLIIIAGRAFVFIDRRRRRANLQPRQESAEGRGPPTTIQTTSVSSPFLSAAQGGLSEGVTTPDRGLGARAYRVREIPLKHLSFITEKFSDAYRVGERGGFGNVYWGHLDGQAVAIKMMTGELTVTKRNQFFAEVYTLSRLHHSNLVDLVGYCQEGNESILVYPYFAGGSLYGRLHNEASIPRTAPGAAPEPPLTLVERMCVAFQVAKGLRYLHTEVEPPIIHRDIKSSNVLLGDGAGADLRAVVADFGLAKICEGLYGTQIETIMLTSHVAGTTGYLAPEYLMRGKLTEKNDVYAFGVILLELLTGRKAVMSLETGEKGWLTIVDWAKRLLGGHLGFDRLPIQMLDTCLRDQVMAEFAMQRMVTGVLALARDCVEEVDNSRPTMSEATERMGGFLSEAKIRGRATI